MPAQIIPPVDTEIAEAIDRHAKIKACDLAVLDAEAHPDRSYRCWARLNSLYIGRSLENIRLDKFNPDTGANRLHSDAWRGR